MRSALYRVIFGKPDEFEPLDFSKSVEVILQTFVVLVGVSLADFFDEGKDKLPEDVRWWAFWALVALLLRYIVGSAIHLNHAYRKADRSQNSPSIRLFLRDVAFLVVLGFFAIQITHSAKFVHFVQQSAWFIGIGFIWSVTDPLLRKCWGKAGQPQKPFWHIWAAIDSLQLAITGGVYYFLHHDPHHAIMVIAVVYALFLAVDFALMLRLQALKQMAVPSAPQES